jgi:biotin carboxylase/biotin carboxyl carrier protein
VLPVESFRAVGVCKERVEACHSQQASDSATCEWLVNVARLTRRSCNPQVGFPLMIKASEGGGGKGIRMVNNMEELRIGYVQVEKEVVGSPIFIQKLGINARHLEVQLVADEYGTAISLYGRDCSVQRRHQKVIEEGPVTVCTPELCRELETGAVRLAEFVNYRSAGTVEFLYSAETKEYSFLEVNPRLQVEHPVTEGITGVCVPAVQLNVAMGIPLHAIPDIREFYMLDPNDTTPIDFKTAPQRPPLCHTVAARITAENPDDGFKPSSGVINELFYRPVKGVSASFSVCGKGAVHQFADSQFGHLFSYAATRAECCQNLLVALKEISIRGEIANNTTALQYIISSDKFQTDTHSTGWLDVLIANNEPMAPPVPDTTAVVCGAVVQARSLYGEQKGEVLDCLERGVTPDVSVSGYAHQAFDLIFGDFKYPIATTVCSDLDGVESTIDITINGGHLQASVVTMHDGGLKLLYGNTSYVLYSERTATGLKVVINGRPCFFPDDADPTALQVPSAGKFLGYLVADGDVVKPGQPYAEIEVMKTVMPLLAQNGPGVVTLLKSAGQALEAGDVLARLTLADGAEVKVAARYTASFPEQLIFKPEGKGLVALYTTAKAAVAARMDGYGMLFDAAAALVKCLAEPSLPKALAEALQPGCPAPAKASLAAILADGNLAVEATKGLASLVGTADEAGEVAAFFAAFSGGAAAHTVAVVTQLLQTYLTVERPFDEAANYQDAVQNLRDGNKAELGKVAGYVLSHSQLTDKNASVTTLLQMIQATKTTTGYATSLPLSLPPRLLSQLLAPTPPRNADTTQQQSFF